MSVQRSRYLARMGIPVWARRTRPGGDEAGASSAEAEAAAAAEAGGAVATQPAAETAPAGASDPRPADAEQAWRQLAAEVAACTQCELHRGRTQTVFGVGRRDASLLVVGEGPGAEEDRQGEPFVGPAGHLLNAMLRAIGFERGDVYIANIVKCRPPRNRDPRPDEAAACSAYLERQIALVRPRAMLAVGRVAAQWLLQSDRPMGRLRGSTYRYGERGIPLVVTYHPAYLLRDPLAKAKSWQDLCMIRALVTEPGEANG